MAKKAAPKAAGAKAAPAANAKAGAGASRPKAATKTEVFGALAEKTKLTKKQVAEVFDAISELVLDHLGKKGPGLFVIPGLIRLKVVHKPATKAKPGKNPATGEPITIPAKPARRVVKAVPLKVLKDSI